MSMNKQQLTFKEIFFVEDGTGREPVFVERLGMGPSAVHVNLPDDLPEGWLVFNAPRPLYGDWSWQGVFRSGIFYVAVDPTEETGAAFIKRNHENDARLVTWVSRADVLAEVVAYYQDVAKMYDRVVEVWGQPEEWPEDEVLRTFVNNLDHTQAVTIEGKTGGLL